MEVQRKPPHLLATHITHTPKISGEQFEHTTLFLLQNLDVNEMQKLALSMLYSCIIIQKKETNCVTYSVIEKRQN